jgi:leader peptidase (prepilin peptidase)/N-methyltransferase
LPDWIAPLLLSPIIGSFLGVLIRRLPRGEAVVATRSRCESCNRTLTARDLIPIVSYLASRGKCRHCGVSLGLFYPAVELAAVAVAVWAVASDNGLYLWADCILGWSLLALAWIDIEHMVLPDVLTLPLIMAGLVFAWVTDPAQIADHAAGAIIGWLLFTALARLYRLLRGRDGLGEGDAKLLAAGGAWITWTGLGPIMLTAAIIGLGYGIAGAMRGGKLRAGTAIPFGPPLALATWLIWLYPPM